MTLAQLELLQRAANPSAEQHEPAVSDGRELLTLARMTGNK